MGHPNDGVGPDWLTLWEKYGNAVPIFPYSNKQLKWSKNGVCGYKGRHCADSCDDRCSWSWPKADPLKWNSSDATCRCNPKGYTYGKNNNPNLNAGKCDGCQDGATTCN